MDRIPHSATSHPPHRAPRTRQGRWAARTLAGLLTQAVWVLSLVAATPRPAYLAALDPTTGLDHRATGELLLAELNCTACHQAAPEILARLQPKPAPLLEHVANRLRPEFVRAWLLDPLRTNPGTTMPDVLRRVPERERETAVEELIHFLWSLAPERTAPGAPAGNLQVQQGRVLYHQTGCVVCHTPYESPVAIFGLAGGGPTDPDVVRVVLSDLAHASQPLPDLAAKYTTSGLAGFLHDPLAIRPGGRMPSLNLTEAEAKAIAGYLQSVTAVPKAGTTSEPRFVSRPGLARRGQERFASIGCAKCHQLTVGATRVRPTLAAPPLDALNAAAPRGCLAPPTAHDSQSSQRTFQAPEYPLSDLQRKALAEVISSPSQWSGPSASLARVGLTLARFNCTACHARDGRGGPTPARADYFTSLSELDSGDEGRLPPHLDAVGAKLRPDWLGQVLTNGGAVRPYMAVRMPQFGAANVASLAADLVATDAAPGAPAEPPPGEVVAGAELVGLPGYSCVTCHSFGPHPSLGISVMDMTQMAKRLHWDWFRRYLLDPASLRPGTRMPAFWPEGQASVTTILGGHTLLQIASIWSYLSLGADAPPPPGLLGSLDRSPPRTPGPGQ